MVRRDDRPKTRHSATTTYQNFFTLQQYSPLHQFHSLVSHAITTSSCNTPITITTSSCKRSCVPCLPACGLLPLLPPVESLVDVAASRTSQDSSAVFQPCFHIKSSYIMYVSHGAVLEHCLPDERAAHITDRVD